MTEVRTVSATGGEKGVKQARFELIPTDSLRELAEHYGKNMATGKYPPDVDGLDNWRRGYEWSKSFGALQRHLNAAMGGEDIDEETGSKHLVAVAWHCMTLIHWMNDPTKAEFDDRQAVIERRRREVAEEEPGLEVGGRYRVSDDAVHWSENVPGVIDEYPSVLRGEVVTLVHVCAPKDEGHSCYTDQNAVVDDGRGELVVGREFLKPVLA